MASEHAWCPRNDNLLYTLIHATYNAHIYLSLWSSDESVPLEQLNEGNLSLQQSQPHPNTDAWTKTKWHVTELRPLGFFFRSEPERTYNILHNIK